MTKPNPKDVQVVNEHLVQCLRDSVFVLNQTQVVHWGLLGSKFYQIHLLTGDIQTEMAEGIDNVAEHIRSINVMTPSSVGDLLTSRIPDINLSDPFDQDKIISDLAISHDMLSGFLEELAKYAGLIGDDLTQDLAVERGRVHKKNQWHLRATMTYMTSNKVNTDVEKGKS
jgi:starvation-inducible DNA-binding protein